MAEFRKSRQRNSILAKLRSTDEHPTADWLFQELKQEFPRLSMGTVYRNLNILEKQGLVLRLKSGSTFDRFDATVHSHCHLICEQCGSVSDLEMEPPESLNKTAAAAGNCRVNRHRVEFYGTCNKCLKSQ